MTVYDRYGNELGILCDVATYNVDLSGYPEATATIRAYTMEQRRALSAGVCEEEDLREEKRLGWEYVHTRYPMRRRKRGVRRRRR